MNIDIHQYALAYSTEFTINFSDRAKQVPRKLEMKTFTSEQRAINKKEIAIPRSIEPFNEHNEARSNVACRPTIVTEHFIIFSSREGL